ncbi:hypothetical protein A3A71_02645 [Candidatus Berkelbacteria bacterium RIFCSPLOWO2_01_FULL_50_28]|uniref:UPF0235 protein A3A71_02645 n=1 Tax=Candidatus Berkelbacteria bacterium RIFCSPLOWO2_01_FULL_50_28 TaxID=1797471 RepID=A0A1F5EC94_9BACT|nr:MAG: hypothetical protein A2807_02135 [Candidatus Berkelbacteria bacterium RIFCSPHIGHO2_01_FULL_50_36]OGD62607.1 MAG: hypothetical protein A3F39_02720 [Candidatus Berkelbacteria bacterium RIFCSPHIGHO2_12_FULL_50_11]OGD64920.1 MAG: hypothetical protein A3A71_02645 [Candidatus Berkelbacteria bacterium RIFCSPLOWO2_01_FULL_50_28]
MKIFVQVKPNSSKNIVEQIDATHYTVSTTAPPVQGKANAAVIELLAGRLHLAKSLFSIKRGANAKQKTIEVQTNRNLFA